MSSRLQNVGLAYVEFAVNQPEHFRVMFSVPVDRARYPATKKAPEEAFDAVVKVATEGKRAGLMTRLEAPQSGNPLWRS